MNYQHDEFQAETVDERIEQISRESAAQSTDGQFITDLQTFYASDTSILANVWQRLEIHQEMNGTLQSQSFTDTYGKGSRPMDTNQHTTEKYASLSLIQESTRQVARRKWPRLVTTWAAILIAALLVGSVLALFNSRNRSQPNIANGTPSIPSQKTAVHPTASATVVPLPKLDCSHVFDNGEHAVCTQGEETNLNVITTIGGHQFALTSAYADTNRIILKYVADGPPISVTYQVNINNVALQGHDLQYATSTGSNYYDTQKKLNIGITSFNDPLIPVGTVELHATMTIGIIVGNAVPIINATGMISFTIPFHTAQRVATPNQTVTTVYAMTLTQVVVSESQTEINLKSVKDFQLSNVTPFQGTLTLATGEKFTNLTFFPLSDTDQPPGYMSGIRFWIPEDLLHQQGKWTFTLSFSGYLGNGNEEFHFTVPPVN